MKKNKSFWLFVAVGAVALLLMGGVSVGSNMGFKLTRALTYNAGNQNLTFQAIPFLNGNANTKDMRTDFGVPTILYWDQATEAFKASAGRNSVNLEKGIGYGLQATSPTTIKAVGSHDPNFSIPMVYNAGNQNLTMVGVPYHWTGANYKDLRTETGASTILYWDQATEAFKASAGRNAQAHTVGDAVFVQLTSSQPNWVPLHY